MALEHTIDFLRLYWSETGTTALYFGKNKPARAWVGQTVEATAEKALDLAAEGFDVYVCMASMKAGTIAGPRDRTYDNFDTCAGLWLDVDIAVEGKKDSPYQTKREVATLVEAFRLSAGLPAPTIVDSGGGLHCHWPLDCNLPLAEWKPLAMALRDRAAAFGIVFDKGCTTDAVRVLRVPGTQNFKLPVARAVRLMQISTPAATEDMERLLLGVPVAAPPLAAALPTLTFDDPLGAAPAALPELPAVAPEASLTIPVPPAYEPPAHEVYTHCAMMRWCRDNPNEVLEPLWRMALSNLSRTKEGRSAAHDLSRGHAHYNEAETDAKIDGTKGPHRCAEIEANFNGTEPPCTGCAFRGRGSQPINVVRLVPVTFTEVPQTIEREGRLTITAWDIPPIPDKYVEIDGEIWDQFHTKNSDGSWGTKSLGQMPVRMSVLSRQKVHEDAQGKYEAMMEMRIERRIDGDTIFTRADTAVVLADDREMTKLLARLNVLTTNNERNKDRIKFMRHYIAKTLDRLNTFAIPRYETMGWQNLDKPGHESFVLGHYEIMRDKVRRVELERDGALFPERMIEKGDFEEWMRVYRGMTEHPKLRRHGYISLVGFGSPLMRLLDGNVAGVVISTSLKSGTGKSTLQNLIASMYGDPTPSFGLFRQSSGTEMTEQDSMVVAANLPVCLDEIIVDSMNPRAVAEVGKKIYANANGQARSRMDRSGRFQVVSKPFSLLAHWSTNKDFYSMIGALEGRERGKRERITQVRLDAIPDDAPFGRATGLSNVLAQHYGFAGRRFLEYIVPNLDAVRRTVNERAEQLEKEYIAAGESRSRVRTAAAMLVGGEIAVMLGVCPLDMKVMAEVAHEVFRENTAEIAGSDETIADWMQGWINENHQSIARYQNMHEKSENTLNPPNQMRFPLVGKMYLDENMLFVSRAALNVALTHSMFTRQEVNNYMRSNKISEMRPTMSRLLAGDAGAGTTDLKCFKVHLAALTKLIGLMANKEEAS